ncbi:MAG: NAD(P)-dependent oxidoreductase [Terrimesophilobacter sp.]
MAPVHELAELAITRLEEVTGTGLSGRTILVVGLGPVGSRVAQLAKSRGMRVLAINRIGQTDLPYVDEIRTSRFLGDLLPVAHAVVLALPLTEETTMMIDAGRITRMRFDAFIINVGSVGVVDAVALLDAVAGGQVAGAALDVGAALDAD